MEKELQGDITNNRINHAYFLECSDEEKGLKEAKEFSENEKALQCQTKGQKNFS